MKTIKIPLLSLDRTSNQHKNIYRNRYVLELSSEPSITVAHEVLNNNKKWENGYSWFGIYPNNPYKDESPDKEYFFGLLKKYDDYYDGPIITWAIGRISINYRW
jgi:hypothetical protein